jgi:hypothetical protein
MAPVCHKWPVSATKEKAFVVMAAAGKTAVAIQGRPTAKATTTNGQLLMARGLAFDGV